MRGLTVQMTSLNPYPIIAKSNRHRKVKKNVPDNFRL